MNRCILLAVVIGMFGYPMWAQPTTEYSHGDPTPHEQYQLELINRARANPAEEGIRVMDTEDQAVQQAYSFFNINKNATKQAFTTYPQRPPLAFHPALITAARAHTADMIAKNFQGHTSSNGDDLGDRYAKVSYQSQGMFGENVSAYAESMWYSHCGLIVDWGEQNQIDLGHRENILNFKNYNYTEIGIGATNSGGGLMSGTVGPWVVTQDFGMRSVRYIVGVCYIDANENGICDPGEGLAGVRIEPSRGTYYAITSTSGGYAIPFTGNGSVTITASGGALSAPMSKTVDFQSDNIKVDFFPASMRPAAAVLTAPPNNASNVSHSGPTLRWNAVQLADDYEVHVATAQNFSQSTIIFNEATDQTSLSLGALTCATQHYWRVRARNGAGAGDWSPVFSFRTDGQRPSSATTTSPKGATTADNNGDLVFTWPTVAGADRYHVKVAATSAFTNPIVDDSTLTTTEYRHIMATSPLTSGNWYWEVRGGSDCGWGGWSSGAAFALTITSVEETTPTTSSLRVEPMPATNDSRIVLTVAEPMQATVEVLAVDGRSITKHDRSLVAGVNSIPLGEILTIRSGVYVVVVTSPTGRLSTLITIP